MNYHIIGKSWCFLCTIAWYWVGHIHYFIFRTVKHNFPCWRATRSSYLDALLYSERCQAQQLAIAGKYWGTSQGSLTQAHQLQLIGLPLSYCLLRYSLHIIGTAYSQHFDITITSNLSLVHKILPCLVVALHKIQDCIHSFSLFSDSEHFQRTIHKFSWCQVSQL